MLNMALRGAIAAALEPAFGDVVGLGQVATAGPFNANQWQFTHDLEPEDDAIVVLLAYRTSSEVNPIVTYGGVSPTLLAVYNEVTIRVAAYYVLAAQLPAPGTAKTVLVDMPGVTRGYAVCVALRGAKQEAPVQNGADVVASSIGSAVTIGNGGAALQAVFIEHDEDINAGPDETVILMDGPTLSGDTALFSRKLDKDGSMSASWTTSGQAAQVTVGVSAANPPPNGGGGGGEPSSFPEEEPLPAPANTLNATPATFDSVYASASAGDHIVLANGSYGTKTLNRIFSAGSPLVIRTANASGAPGATPTTSNSAFLEQLTFSGSGHIVSGVAVVHSTATFGYRVGIGGSDNRLTRSILKKGGHVLQFLTGATNILVDHCELSHYHQNCVSGENQQNMSGLTIARCWFHDGLERSNATTGAHTIDMNIPQRRRQDQLELIIRLSYLGPGLVAGNDHIHNKGSNVLFAFNRVDTISAGDRLMEMRYGLRQRLVGNYAPNERMLCWDMYFWAFGNSCSEYRIRGGNSNLYDETKNAVTWNGESEQTSIFYAIQRARFAGNTGTALVGNLTAGSETSWCNQSPQAAGRIKPQASANGITYDADGIHADNGIKIRAHSGAIAFQSDTAVCANAPGGGPMRWYENVESQPSAAAPSVWLADLLALYPWIEDLCPDPTNLTGGPGGSAPWTIAQALTRGDAANPNVGPFRDSPAGLP